MIDLHSHVLWNRDGTAVPEDLCMDRLREACKDGVTDLVVTPYIRRGVTERSWQSIVDRVEAVKTKAFGAGIPVRLYAGAELELDDHIWHFLWADKPDYCLAGSHYVLLSVRGSADPGYVERTLYEMMLKGFQPIITRAELSPFFYEYPQRLLNWLHQGAILQCDMASYAGFFSDSSRRRAEDFVRHHMVTLLGSGTEAKIPYDAMAATAEKTITDLDVPWDTWNKCKNNSERVLADRLFYPLLPEYWETPHRSLFARLFGL